MRKVKTEIYCYLTADILTKVLQKCSFSSPLPNLSILSKPLNLIGCHGNQNDEFVKKISKIIFSEAIRGVKLKLCTNSRYKKKKIVNIVVAHVLLLLRQLKVSIDL